MQLLISTPLHLFLIDPETRQISFLRSGDGYYYGITANDRQVVLTHTGGNLQYFRPGAAPRVSIPVLVQPHQVEWIEDKVIVSNTGRNCLTIFDVNGNFLKDVYLNTIRSDDKEKNRKGNHFNTVHRRDDKLYVVAHNYERPSEVWILNWPSLQVIEQKATGAAWAHNIWIGEHGMVVCDSKNGALHEVTTGRTLWQSKLQPVMTRGLAASPDYVFVGRSGHNSRSERFWKDGGIWVLDRATLQLLDEINLPGVGDVHEIRLLGSLDSCHNDHMITVEDLAPLKSQSLVIQWAYHLRKLSPSLRRNFFPMSQIVRATQASRRWWLYQFRRSRQRLSDAKTGPV